MSFIQGAISTGSFGHLAETAGFKFNPKLHWTLASSVLAIDIILVTGIILLDKFDPVKPPASGTIDSSAPIGWLSVFGGIFCFGCYGVLIKTPSVSAANCDCMVFQCYYSVAVAVTSFLIWLISSVSSGLTLTGSSFAMGLMFGLLWISSQALAFIAIEAIGYAVAPAIWIGVTITVSFVWGVAVFDNPVISWPGALCAIALLLFGVCLAAYSNTLSDKHKAAMAAGGVPQPEGEARNAALMAEHSGEIQPAKSKVVGACCAIGLGLCNGSLMVPMTCFQKGCEAIGVSAYEGDVVSSLAFLPSLSIGVLIMQPVLFLLWWGPSMAKGTMPKFHFAAVGVSGLLTGVFWAMGNFSAMFATVYLGQTIGFPLTQLCLILNGFWGIFYYKEIVGAKGIGTFVLAAIIIIIGAGMDGIWG